MLSRLAIRRRVTTMMITMMVFLAGIVSYMNLDMNLMPEMDIPIVVVSTTYVGAGPEEIENLVTKPLEESLSTVSNVENITSGDHVDGYGTVCRRHGHRHRFHGLT